MNFNNYPEALDYIYSLTMTGNHRIFGHLGLERVKYLLSLVDNPQDQVKIIHVAGTSGKGWTCYILSELLQKVAKKKVWLHVSPHLVDLRERMQINGQLVNEQTFVDCLNILTPAIQTVSESFFWAPSYYEVTTCLSYLIFAHQKVDYAIIEVGCGWLLDGTNVSDKAKYCIITKQWFDHMDIVGNTMTEITRNDAGIITPNSTVITLQHGETICNDIIDYRCQTKNAKKIVFNLQKDLQNINYQSDQTVFDYTITIPWELSTFNFQLSTSLLGPFHLENLGLALTAFFTICEQSLFPLEKGGRGDLVLTTLQALHRKGRFDLISYENKNILLDWAHNPQKMQALINTLNIIFPKHFGSSAPQLFSFYLSFKQGKQRQEMLDIIIPHAKEIIIGDFMVVQDFKLHSVSPQEILDYLHSKGYENTSINTDPLNAIENHKDSHPLIITWSLYFLSCIYTKLSL